MNFYLGGHDWGSAVVQEMALLQPEKIKKLILINMVIINNFEERKSTVRYLLKACLNLLGISSSKVFRIFSRSFTQGKEDVWIRFFSRGISRPIPGCHSGIYALLSNPRHHYHRG